MVVLFTEMRETREVFGYTGQKNQQIIKFETS